MLCPSCGHKADDTSATCAACGRVLRGRAAETSAGDEASTIAPPPSNAASASRTTPPRAAPPRTSGSGPLILGQVIHNRYRVIKLLGQGGMGAVYQAWDDELGVSVAIKMLLAQPQPGSTSHEESDRRLKKELLLARQITHRNVVRIHDIDEVDGMKFISMPFVKGEDLSTVLKRGPLPVRKALSFARQIASGLAAAHEAGVIHRDLKPANIMIEDGEHALLMDFGIARSARTGTGPITIAGTVVGTIEYMAPEQARGEVVDGRADVYAFGLILYEMLSGKRNFGADAVTDLVARMTAAPAPVRTLNPEVPAALDAIVTRCLQPQAADRYASSAELVRALEGLDAEGQPVIIRAPSWSRSRLVALGAAVMLVAAAVTYFMVGGAPPVPIEREPVSLLIADFDNQARDPVFDGSLENALSVAMEGASFITSFGRDDANRVNATLRPGSRLDEEGARLVSRREGVKVVLAGTIGREGTGYRLTVRAIDPVQGTLVASATEEAGTKADVLSAVNSIAARLREALGDTTAGGGRLAPGETFTAATLEAAQEYSRGQELLYQAKYEAAIEAYRKAIEHDREMGGAYAGWALAAAILGRTEEAESLYKQALARIDRMTEREKFRTLGTYYSRVARNPEQAIENHTLLIRKFPADASALNNLAVAHFRAMHFDDALEFGKRLVSLYPERVQWRYNYALYAMYAGDFHTARVHGEEALKRNPDTPKAYLAIAMAALAAGETQQAAEWWDRAAKSGPQGASLAATGFADLALYQGRHADAAGILAPAIEKDRDAKNTAGAAIKLMTRAEAMWMGGRAREALALAQEAVKISRADAITVPAARLMLAAGATGAARTLAADLLKRLNAQSRAYGHLIEAEAALKEGRTQAAIDTLRAGLKLADLWLLRFTLGTAFVQNATYADARTELEACEKRRGEATAVFLNDEPSWRYMAPLAYWLARARDGLGLKDQATAGYKAFLALRPASPADPLVIDARRRTM